MANINAVISLGVGTPGDIPHFVLVGLSVDYTLAGGGSRASEVASHAVHSAPRQLEVNPRTGHVAPRQGGVTAHVISISPRQLEVNPRTRHVAPRQGSAGVGGRIR